VFPLESPENNKEATTATTEPVAATPIVTPVDSTDDVEGDESDIDIVLSQMKDRQHWLQNLLHKHKRLTKKIQPRVLTLEHRNWRKLCVILPPESQTSNAFVDEAKKSCWVNDMLHSEVQQQGMLLCLAQAHPDVCLKVGKQKRINLQKSALSTPQTIALGRLTGINDSQLQKIRSFLKKFVKPI